MWDSAKTHLSRRRFSGMVLSKMQERSEIPEMKRLIRFYTTPPTMMEYPYIIVSLNTWQYDKSKRNIKSAIHIIIDSGVEKWFFLKHMKDYPDAYHTFAPFQFKQIFDQLGPDRVRITIPDYPDDYTQGLTYEGELDNVDKTLQNMERYTRLFPEITWLPVAQARFLNVDSFKYCLSRMGKYVDKYGWLGIGTVCKTHNVKFIGKCMSLARKEFPDAHIHAFGATSESYPIIRHYINSFDSTAYSWYYKTADRKTRLVKTQEERQIAFVNWVLMIKEKFAKPFLELEKNG